MEDRFIAAASIDELKDQVQELIDSGESNSEITGNELLREFKFDAECAVQCQLPTEFINVLANVQSLQEDLPNINFSKERALEMLKYFIKHGTIFVGIYDDVNLKGREDIISLLEKENGKEES